jgi:hypothetical protein
MSALFLTHTPADGTLLAGTSRGEGSAAVLKRRGRRWSRQMLCWYIPNSRDRHPQQNLISTTVDRLEELNLAADVQISQGTRSAEHVESDRDARSTARAEHLQAKADGLRASAASAAQQATDTAQRMTTPQPILVGHPSEQAMRRHYDTVSRSSQAALEAETRAAEAEAAASTSMAARQHRNDPAYIGRQILRLEADIRGIVRQLVGSARKLSNGTIESTPAATGQLKVECETQLEQLGDFLRYWKMRQEEIQEASGIPSPSRATVSAGDVVQYDGDWYTVLRANEKTVTVFLGKDSGSVRYSYSCLQDHRPNPAGS